MKTLKNFEFKTASIGESKHDWDKILDGGIYQLERGKDYECEDQTMRMMAGKQGRKRGLSVKVNKVDGGIVVQASKASKEQLAAWRKADEEAKAKKAAAKAETSEE